MEVDVSDIMIHAKFVVCRFYLLPPTLASILLAIFFCTNHVISHRYSHPNHSRPMNAFVRLITHKLCLFGGSPNFTYKCEDSDFEMHPLAQLQCLVLRSKPNTRAIHLTLSWLFVEGFGLRVMVVGRCMKVFYSRANSMVSGFIKPAPYCLPLLGSPLVLCLCFSYILFLTIYDLMSAYFATNPCFVPITTSISVPKL